MLKNWKKHLRYGATVAEIKLLDLSAQSVIAGELLVGTGAGTAAWQKTGVTLSAPDISGTVTAAVALTMPAFTANGDISIGANFLKTTNLTFGQWTASSLYIRNAGNTDWLGLGLMKLTVHEGISINVDAGSIDAKNTAANYFTLKARDTGAGALQEVMRIGGAAIPFMSMATDTQVGFFGAAVVSQQTGADALNTSYAEADIDTDAELVAVINVITTEVNALRTATNNLGLTTVV